MSIKFINNLAAKATFLLLNLSTFPLLFLGAVNVEISFGAARGAPTAMEMSWSGISKIDSRGWPCWSSQECV